MRLEITASNAIVRTLLLTDPAVFPMIPRLLSEGTSSLARYRYAQLFLEVWPIVSQDRDRDDVRAVGSPALIRTVDHDRWIGRGAVDDQAQRSSFRHGL